MISSDNCLFNGHFNNLKITEHSKIIYTGFLNSKKNVMQCGFAVYPSIYSLLGFIQNIFLSTGFFTWCDENTDAFCITMATFDTVISETCSDIAVNKKTLKTTCKSVLAEPFINEKFIDILNTSIPILF